MWGSIRGSYYQDTRGWRRKKNKVINVCPKYVCLGKSLMHGIAGELNFICLRFFLIANSLAFTSKREQPSQGEGTGRGQKHPKSCSHSW